MKITETVKAVTYSDGKRIATVERTASRADDAEKLGDLYFRLSDVYRRKQDCTDENELAALEADRAKISAEIAEYTGYLDGYESEE